MTAMMKLLVKMMTTMLKNIDNDKTSNDNTANGKPTQMIKTVRKRDTRLTKIQSHKTKCFSKILKKTLRGKTATDAGGIARVVS